MHVLSCHKLPWQSCRHMHVTDSIVSDGVLPDKLDFTLIYAILVVGSPSTKLKKNNECVYMSS